MSTSLLARHVRRFLLAGNPPPAERSLVDRHVPEPRELSQPLTGPFSAVESDSRTVAWLRNLNGQPRQS